ncbi:hypothetical protein R9C00_16465 [Flammeovirgaceae bacterium SG7u.111]|nr:hypothetical protein [Flammeovirgaceae bacterium SG7u.132]WPO33296.1 hypothetical protein R9C00_16465 [Flammeovirgaceae bacterium SG7u.111]
MKLSKKLIFILVLLSLLGCADENLKPILTFEDSGKGAYIKLMSESDKLINVFDETTINASKYTYSVEFKDTDDGKKVTEYRLSLIYEPAGGGEDITVSTFLSWGPSDFVDSEDGLKSLQDVTITTPEMLSALGISAADLAPGDNFKFEGFITLDDGQVFGYENSSAAVRGAAFQAHFNFTLPAACPSDLEGTFEYESTTWCGGSATGSVDIEALGGGVYVFSDWSFGAYGDCYGGGAANSTTLTFTDVCTEVSFTGFVDVYGDTWTFVSTIEGDVWTIDWENTYGEAGVAKIMYPGGVDWPITLK